MRDAIGGYFNLTLLFFFIILVSALIALAISYTRTYRVKNNVISYVEKYEGNMDNKEMLGSTFSYIKSVGYKANSDSINAATRQGYKCATYEGEELGWCYKKNSVSTSEDNEKSVTVDMVFFVNLNIPFINRIFSNISFFWMNGSTSTIPVFD